MIRAVTALKEGVGHAALQRIAGLEGLVSPACGREYPTNYQPFR